MTTISKFAWMSRLCEPALPSISRPFPVFFEGRRWGAATNAHAILLVREAKFRHRKAQPKDSALRKTFSRPRMRRRGTITLKMLRAWSTTEGNFDPGLVLGVTVNRNLLRRYLASELTAKRPLRVSVSGELDQVFIRGDAWVLVVMPCRPNKESRPAGGLPRCPIMRPI